MGKIKVLYIDDEIINLSAFKASFRRLFDIYTAKSALDGIKLLDEIAIEVIIADQRMPDKTGVDFFESILETHPNPIRILLTAYSDKNAIIDAINKGQVYRYITKPWNDLDIKLTIENAYQLYVLKEQNNEINYKYKKVFSESTDPIILFDTTGSIVDYNKATLSLINNPIESEGFTSFRSIIYNESEAKYVLGVLRKKGTIKDYECEIVTKKSQKKLCLISGNVIMNNYGEIINYQVIVKDITERNKVSQLLLKKTIETQELERERIARDLHDGIGQSLAGISMHLESLKVKYHSDNEISDELEKLPNLVSETIANLRKICFNTLPLVIQSYGLIKAIETLRTNFTTRDFKLDFRHKPGFPTISKSLEISIFRIIQEFISNSSRHSHATEVKIDLSCNEEFIILNLRDNGIGFSITDMERFKGRGLRNINTRIQSFKGNLKIITDKDRGTEFDIEIPTLL